MFPHCDGESFWTSGSGTVGRIPLCWGDLAITWLLRHLWVGPRAQSQCDLAVRGDWRRPEPDCLADEERRGILHSGAYAPGSTEATARSYGAEPRFAAATSAPGHLVRRRRRPVSSISSCSKALSVCLSIRPRTIGASAISDGLYQLQRRACFCPHGVTAT